MTMCAGRCGREATGRYDSGQPELDRQHVWGTECQADLAARRIPAGLRTFTPFAAPLPSLPHELSALGTEHKILPVQVKTAVLEDTGTLSGYLAAVGNKDLQGDTIEPGALDDTLADFRAGRLQWFLTDAHSEKASDTVAEVTGATVDSRGLRIAGRWMATETAQRLRGMVRRGVRLGLSIDYLPVKWRPDPSGGRFLSKVSVYGGAVTPKPANPMAYITEGKGMEAWAPVIEWGTDAQAQAERNDPQRLAEDRLLAAASWPPRHFDRATRLALIQGAAEAKAHREDEGDPVRERAQRRRDFDNRYCLDLAAWMAANR